MTRSSRSSKNARRSWLRKLGPGLITGAADDDPSGIATYSATGAAHGYRFLWLAPATFPLIVAVQLMCARLALVSGRGLARVLRDFYPRPILYGAITLLAIANTFNIAADLRAMAAVTALATGGTGGKAFVIAYAAAILALLAFAHYRAMARVFKFLTFALFAYIAAAFIAVTDWSTVLRATVVPSFDLHKDTTATLVAVLGTTISPYLFFWQADEEVEEEISQGRRTVAQRRGATHDELVDAREDITIGMSLSSAVFYFVVLTAAATLHAAGIHQIDTAEQAAQALRPVAGDGAALLFSTGIIGTGLLAVAVLASTSSLAIAECAGWKCGMSETPATAGKFYAVMSVQMAAATATAFVDIEPMRLLVWSAVLNGILAPPLIFVVLAACNNRRIMGKHTNGWGLNSFGLITGTLMAGAAILLIVQLL